MKVILTILWMLALKDESWLSIRSIISKMYMWLDVLFEALYSVSRIGINCRSHCEKQIVKLQYSDVTAKVNITCQLKYQENLRISLISRANMLNNMSSKTYLTKIHSLHSICLYIRGTASTSYNIYEEFENKEKLSWRLFWTTTEEYNHCSLAPFISALQSCDCRLHLVKAARSTPVAVISGPRLKGATFKMDLVA